MSTGTETRLRGTCAAITGIAPDGVGKSAPSRFPPLRGLRARKAQKSIQAHKTPSSVQDKIICAGAMAACMVMLLPLFRYLYSFSDTQDSRHSNKPAVFQLLLVYLTNKAALNIVSITACYLSTLGVVLLSLYQAHLALASLQLLGPTVYQNTLACTRTVLLSLDITPDVPYSTWIHPVLFECSGVFEA